MSGWGPPPGASAPGPGPVVGWVPPSDVPGLSVGDILREGWRLTTSHLGSLAIVAAVPIVLQLIVTLPLWLAYGRLFERTLDLYAHLDWDQYVADPEAFRQQFEGALQPTTGEALAGGIGTAILLLVWMVGLTMVAAATLDAAAGGRPSVGRSLRTALDRPRTVILPAIVLAIGYAVIIVPISLNSASIAFGDAGRERVAITSLLSLVVFAIEVVVAYLAVRWAPYFQVVAAEDPGLRDTLRRSSEVTEGIRIRLAVALVILAIAVGIVTALVGGIVGIVVGIALRSFWAAVVAWSVAFSVAGLVYLPLFAATLTYVYRERVRAVADAGESGAPLPPSG